MTERRVLPSHPDYKELAEHAQMLAIATNPQLFFNVQEIPAVEQAVLLDDIYVGMHELLEGGIMRDFINLMEI